MKNTITILVLLIFSYLKVFSQESKIIGMIDGSLQNSTSIQIVTFDYANSIYDTLSTINEDFWVGHKLSAIDLQRNVIYFIKAIEGVCGVEPQIVYSYNINTSEVEAVVDLDPYACMFILDMFYDMFSNSLIYRDRCSIRSYNITTGEHKLICELFYRGELFRTLTTYNPISGKLLYFEGATNSIEDPFNLFAVFVDVSKGKIENTIKLDTSLESVDYLACDILRDKYYSVNPLTNKIIEIDPKSGKTIDIATVCFDNWYHNPEHLAVFDYYNQTFIFPIFQDNKSISNFLTLVDITDKSSSCISFQECYHAYEYHLFSGKDVLLKLDSNKLEASNCQNYRWYLNGLEILYADSQYFTPVQTGLYKFSTYIEGAIYYSNEILFQPLAINSVSIDNELLIYPNPTTNEINIEFPQTFTGLKNIILYDLYGKIILSNKTETTKFSQKYEFVPGIYYLKIIYEDKTLPTKKIIVI
jgi:hypothetical protein